MASISHVKHGKDIVTVILAINVEDSKKQDQQKMKRKQSFGFVPFWCHSLTYGLPGTP